MQRHKGIFHLNFDPFRPTTFMRLIIHNYHIFLPIADENSTLIGHVHKYSSMCIEFDTCMSSLPISNLVNLVMYLFVSTFL